MIAQLKTMGLALSAAGVMIFLTACGGHPSATPGPVPAAGDPGAKWGGKKVEAGWCQAGIGCWYGPGLSGNKTASGERYNAGALTAAHRSLAFNTRVKVTLLKTGKSVVVRINDRGPFVGGRIIDISSAAAEAIGLKPFGISKVTIEAVD